MIDPINVKEQLAQSRTVEQPLQFVGNPALHRVIRWYEKTGDRYVGETSMKALSLAELQALFEQPNDDPMVDCYAITPEQVDQIQAAIQVPINLDLYDYFLECDAG